MCTPNRAIARPVQVDPRRFSRAKRHLRLLFHVAPAWLAGENFFDSPFHQNNTGPIGPIRWKLAQKQVNNPNDMSLSLRKPAADPCGVV
jgi:hypothetical protein